MCVANLFIATKTLGANERDFSRKSVFCNGVKQNAHKKSGTIDTFVKDLDRQTSKGN